MNPFFKPNLNQPTFAKSCKRIHYLAKVLPGI